MLELYFESDKEVICFCEHLFCYNKQIELYWKTHKDWGNHIQFKHSTLTSDMMNAISKSMVHVFVSHRLSRSIKRVIMEDFYYTDDDEIERILDLTNWIIDEGDDFQQRRENPRRFLQNLFFDVIIHNDTVHFDSVVNFRLKAFRNELRYFVGLAIDEFKQEEEHQAFIELLRKYIVKKQTKYDVIHVLQGTHFTFFLANGKRFSKLDLRKTMQKEPLYIVGLDTDEFNLSPLIAMAPKKIKIYGDNPSEPKTLTVINVFQERVDFLPYSQFPFSYYTKKY